MANYHFITNWDIDAPVQDVWDAILDSSRWPEWWHGVTRVEELERGSADGVGNVRRYTFRSVLPYDLVFDMRTTRAEPLRALDGTASGELIGEGRWRLMDDGPAKTLVRYDWEVSTAKEWMNAAAPLLRPAFAWNHDVIMGWGERGLRAYLAGKR